MDTRNTRSTTTWAATLALVLAVPTLVHAQSEDSLLVDQRRATEQRLEALEAHIRDYEERLEATAREERSELSTLDEVDRQITVRQELISTYRQRNSQLSRDRTSAEQRIALLQHELQIQKQLYKDIVRHAYKHGRLDYLALLLTSGSLNQMLVRVKYLRAFMNQRQKRLREIQYTSDELAGRHDQLASTQLENERLIEKDRQERDNLRRLREQRTEVIEDIREKRSSLAAELDNSRREAEQLQERLRAIIAADASNTVNLDPVETAELAGYAASFDQRKGRLPWPASGVVTENFGTRVHPVYKTKTPNPGIEIATRPGAEVEAVHDGIVNRILAMPGYGTMITLSHGAYTTVYGNMSQIAVQQGQRIVTGQVIGRSGTQSEPRKTALFFALFTPDGEPVNPTTWLRDQ